MRREFSCPGCRTVMQQETHPDIVIDKCPSYKGVFLDKGELNTMLTGMAGTIEMASVDDYSMRQDQYKARPCPLCQGRWMRKINLLCHGEVVFDRCENSAASIWTTVN